MKKKKGNGEQAPKVKVIGQIMISQLENGDIEVGLNNIPQGNLLVLGKMLTEAHRLLLNNVAMALEKQNQSRIMTPGGARTPGGIITPGRG